MKVLALLYVYGQSSHGVATPIRDTPRDDLSIRKSNVLWFPSSHLFLILRDLSRATHDVRDRLYLGLYFVERGENLCLAQIVS